MDYAKTKIIMIIAPTENFFTKKINDGSEQCFDIVRMSFSSSISKLNHVLYFLR